MKDGAYVSDILPSVIESLCREPDRFRVSVLELDEEREKYLRGLHRIFTAGPEYEVPEADLVRLCHDALEAWKAQLPVSGPDNPPADSRRPEAPAAHPQGGDPVRLIMQDLPHLGGEGCEINETLGNIRIGQAGADGCHSHVRATGRSRCPPGDTPGGSDRRKRLQAVVKEWSSCFSQSFVKRMGQASTTTSLLKIMQMKYRSDEKLADSLATLLVGQPLARWDDSTIAHFERELQATVQQIEESALDRSACWRTAAPLRACRNSSRAVLMGCSPSWSIWSGRWKRRGGCPLFSI